MAYWELMPTLDHIVPVTRGGQDHPDNWITASMMSNGAKAGWTLEQLGWKIPPPGNLSDWDGLMGIFMSLVESDTSRGQEQYIRQCYRLAKTILDEQPGR